MGAAALVEEARRRVDELIEAHRGEAPVAVASGLAPAPVAATESNGRGRGADAAIRPERFARLVTLASVLIAAGRTDEAAEPLRQAIAIAEAKGSTVLAGQARALLDSLTTPA